MLAILKLGAAFVIIESHTPQDKLNEILFESKASCMILSNPISENVTINLNTTQILDMKKNGEEIAKQPDTNPSVEQIEDSQLAYLLFTSGSTSSRPKAVMQTRKGLFGQMQNYAKDLGICSKDRLLQISHIAHDQALCNIFGALVTGASLVFHDLSEKLEPKEVKETMIANNITIFTSISSVFSLIFQDIKELPSSLRLIRLGGESVNLEHLKLYCDIATDRCSFGIGYGATECSWIAYNSLTKQEAQQIIAKNEQIPLGKFSSHITHSINAEGELCISSPYLSSGYQDNEEAQKAAFFDDNQKRYYRTGDLFKTVDSKLCFNGRTAWHVKMNGQRVSLKEVEEKLKAQFPSIERCEVITDEDNKNLYAFYKLKPGSKQLSQNAQNTHEIRQALVSVLASHESPADYFELEEFPQISESENRSRSTETRSKETHRS